MTWGVVAGTAVSAVASNRASSNAKRASRNASALSKLSADEAADAQEKGYSEAESRLSPYIKSEYEANRQRMAQMGITPDYTREINELERRIASLRESPLQFDTTGADGNRMSFLQGKLGAAGADGRIYEDIEDGSEQGFTRTNVTDRYQQEYDDLISQRTQTPGEISAEAKDEIAALQDQIAEYQRPVNASTAYMDTPGYAGAITEGTAAVNQGAAGSGSLYSGSRGEALKTVGQGVQQSYYSNYMNMLQNMANPSATTNLSNIGIGVAGNIGSQNIASAAQQNQYNLMGTQAQNAAYADIAGGISSGVSAYMNQPQTQQPAADPLAPVWN